MEETKEKGEKMSDNFDITKNLYTYKAVIVEVYDGDTYKADIDLGMGVIKRKEKIRLAFVDTPELKGEERERGLEVRDHVKELILNKEVYIQTFKDRKGKWGRYIADIYLEADPRSLSEYLIENNMAEWY
jgi:micrococcal nuclease